MAQGPSGSLASVTFRSKDNIGQEPTSVIDRGRPPMRRPPCQVGGSMKMDRGACKVFLSAPSLPRHMLATPVTNGWPSVLDAGDMSPFLRLILELVAGRQHAPLPPPAWAWGRPGNPAGACLALPCPAIARCRALVWRQRCNLSRVPAGLPSSQWCRGPLAEAPKTCPFPPVQFGD